MANNKNCGKKKGGGHNKTKGGEEKDLAKPKKVGERWLISFYFFKENDEGGHMLLERQHLKRY